MLLKRAGNMDNGTHLLLVEYATWDDYINADAHLDDVTRALLGRPRTDLASEVYFPLRDVIAREVYVHTPAGM